MNSWNISIKANVPIFTEYTLNHLVLNIILFIWIWPMAHTVHTWKVLIVCVFVVVFHFIGVQFTTDCQYFGCTTIATEVSLCVQFNQIMSIMTFVAASQTHASPFFGFIFGLWNTCQTCIKCLPFNISLKKPINICLCAYKQNTFQNTQYTWEYVQWFSSEPPKTAATS